MSTPPKVEVPMTSEHWADLTELRRRLRTPSNAETFRAAVRDRLGQLRAEEHERAQADASKRALLQQLEGRTP